MPTELKFSELTPLSAYSSTSIIAIESDPAAAGGFFGHISTDNTMSDAAANLLSTSLSIKTYVDSSVSAVSFWVRTAPEIKPLNAGDDLNMPDGEIYSIDAANTSGTKSISIVHALTDATPAAEYSSVDLNALFNGTEKPFLSTSSVQTALIYNNSSISLTDLEMSGAAAVSGANFSLQKYSLIWRSAFYIIENSTPDQTIANEKGLMEFSTMEGGSLTKYLELNGTTATIGVFKPFADGATAVTQSPADNSTKLATTAYVDSAVLVENIWDRDVSGFIKPQNAGDNLNMLQGTIYTVDPSNTSGTKSYEISQILTGVVPASEHASTIFTGLSQGSQKTFMTYFGASNTIEFGGENWTFNNTVGTIGQVLYKVNLNTVGGSGWFFDQVIAKNSVSTETIYYQDRAIIASNTAGSENGIHVFDVMENGTLTEYIRLDAGAGFVTFSKPATFVDNTRAITQSPADNTTKLATTAYVEAAVSVENLWDRVTGTPNYLIPQTTADDIGATGARITKGWFTDIDTTNIRVSGPAFGFGIVRSNGSGDMSVGQVNLADPTFEVKNILGQISGGTGFTTSAYANGKILIGSGNSLVVNTITGTANQITVTNGAGTITLSLPSDLILPSTTTGTTQSPADNSTKIATTAYVDSAVLIENIWDRTGTTIEPKTANDDLDMRSGNVFASNYESEYAFYVVSPTNTSGSRSFTAEALLTDATPLSEASKVTLYGLYSGSARNFMDYDGQTDVTTHRSDIYEYNNGATSNSTLLRYISTVNSAVNVHHVQQHMALNSVAATKIYSQFESVITNATAGSESGQFDFSVMGSGSLSVYLELDGSTGTIIGKKPLNMQDNPIFMIDPANTSGTKSFNLVETLLSASVGNEYGSVELKGLSNGTETTFIKHLGDALSLEGTLEFTALNIVHKSSVGNTNFILNDSSISPAAPSGTVHLDISNRAYNSTSTLVPYSQIKSYQMGNTAGSEYGKYQIIVRENGAQVIYADYDASTASIRFYKDVGIGATPDASARLDVTSTTKGFLPPRMTTGERTAIASPAPGLEVYDLTLNQWFGWNATAWVILG